MILHKCFFYNKIEKIELSNSISFHANELKNILINVDRLKKKKIRVLKGVPAFFISHMLFVLINFNSFKNCNPLLLFELCLLVTSSTCIAILLIQLKVSGVKCLKKIMFV